MTTRPIDLGQLARQACPADFASCLPFINAHHLKMTGGALTAEEMSYREWALRELIVGTKRESKSVAKLCGKGRGEVSDEEMSRCVRYHLAPEAKFMELSELYLWIPDANFPRGTFRSLSDAINHIRRQAPPPGFSIPSGAKLHVIPLSQLGKNLITKATVKEKHFREAIPVVVEGERRWIYFHIRYSSEPIEGGRTRIGYQRVHADGGPIGRLREIILKTQDLPSVQVKLIYFVIEDRLELHDLVIDSSS